MIRLNPLSLRRGLVALGTFAWSCGNPSPPTRTADTTPTFEGNETTQTELNPGRVAAQQNQPRALEQEEQRAAPEPSPESASSRASLIEMARACIAHKNSGALVGVHGSPLQFDKATLTSPREWRDRGEKGSFAQRGDEYRSVYVPESQPFDERVPNGIAFELNTRTGVCTFARWAR